MHKEISIPEMKLLYWYSDKKEAEIDFEKNELTTQIDGVDCTQKFHRVKKYELFSVFKYGVMALFIFSMIDFSITLHNEIALLTAAAILVVWHQWRHNDKTLFKVGETEFSAFAVMISSIAGIVFLFMIIGIFTGTILYVGRAGLWSFLAILGYETFFLFSIQEWQQMRKIYVKGLPPFIPRYFKLPEDANNKKRIRSTRKKIEKSIMITAGSMAAIGLIGLTYSGTIIFKDYKAQNVAMQKYNAEQRLADLKLQAEQNGSVQTIIRYEKVQLAPNVEELQRKMNIPAQYKEIKEITYPWEKGYRGGYTTIIKPPKEQQ